MKNEVGEVRPGQLITTYGPGAIMDSLNDSLVILDINYWGTDLEEIYDNRLASFLKKNHFKKIPTNNKRDLPAIPFPNYHVCSNVKCRRLFDIRKKFDMKSYLEKGPQCPKCESKAYPARFVVSCDKGNHLDDFPWRWWAHKNTENFNCEGELQLTSTGNNSGLSSMKVRCLACESENNMGQATQKNSFKELNCSGNHPHRMNFKETCPGSIIPLQRGASNVYFSVLRSAISIPEKEEEWVEVIVQNSSALKENEEDYGERGLQKTYERRIESLGLFESYEKFKEAWLNFKSRLAQTADEIDRYEQIKEIEYESLTGLNTLNVDEKDFKVEEVVITKDLKKYFSKIVKAHRLKEILVLLGFTRNDSPEPDVKDPKEIVWLGGKNTNWLPAIEIFGEGIFIEFNREALNDWLESNKKALARSGKYKKLYQEYMDKKGWKHQSEKDAIYVVMHTLSHLLMKEMSLKSGYSSSALKERIYYNEKMAGILIYTGSADQEGSLGGLVEMGEIENFRKLLLNALDEAKLCSNDPNCSVQEPTDDNYINGSSCFACTMLPETACEVGNMLLDRSLVVKTMESDITPFFEGLL